ncbi:hypothetical protein PMKS-002057 [Pichia membranifaciens]|uniref:Major facilitator superfamily (MFS) profile domain-containing protein n=1 Tax=Pichia membranifaciens TaxID=4926 RepID=A0A1Q2YG78_9ASCO|nr:hypothetical protein PMKS-002057 [Pichia membranifaciens]
MNVNNAVTAIASTGDVSGNGNGASTADEAEILPHDIPRSVLIGRPLLIFTSCFARSSGSSLATATNWICNFIVGQSAPILLEKISWRLYLIHSVSCFTSFAVVYWIYPETKGLSLEEMDSIFNDSTSSRHPSFASSTTSTPVFDLEQRVGGISANVSTNSTPLLPAMDDSIDVEIPSLKSIHKFKTDDSKSIRSFKSWVG